MQNVAQPTGNWTRLRMRQVALLLEIERRGTLRLASERLGISQPAATKMLRELEAALGHRLFERIGRRIRPTAFGACALRHFHGLSGTAQALSRELDELHLGSARQLRVGSIMAPAPTHLVEALTELRARYPLLSVRVVVDTSDRLAGLLRDGDLDVAIARPADAPDQSQRDFVFHPIGEEALSIVASCAHPLARRRGRKRITFAALLSYPWILQPHGSPMREVIEREFRSNRAALPGGLIEATSTLITTSLVARSEMIAVIPHSVASQYDRHGLLCVLPYTIRHRLSSWGTLLYRHRSANAVTEQFIDLLRDRHDASLSMR
ncbi:MAG: LysR family transcriptional regulator [Burkholderiales bacterium]|nr:LysR family transcriptional regulator [Burkholderiales bacterium]